MIRFEDPDFEEFFFDELPDVAIPIEVHLSENGELIITTYQKTADVAREYEARFSDAPFSKSALQYLDSKLRPQVVSWGYRPDKRCESHILNFVATDTEEINRSVILPSSQIVYTLPEGIENRTTYDFDEAGEDPIAIIVEDGAVVSLACVNPYDDEEERELNTETAPSYRRRGYSASNVACLAERLIAEGKRVTYNCNTKNAASRRVAEKCGFASAGQSYYYVCYREE